MNLLTIALALALTQAPAHDAHHDGLNQRGEAVMGFDQATTTHHFKLTRDGGSIEVTANDAADTAAIAQIRMHLQHIAKMFAEGNFAAPMLVHGTEPPGVDRMRAAGNGVTYTFESIDRGARVRIATTSAAALDGVHAFLRFQIQDHKTGDPLQVQR